MRIEHLQAMCSENGVGLNGIEHFGKHFEGGRELTEGKHKTNVSDVPRRLPLAFR